MTRIRSISVIAVISVSLLPGIATAAVSYDDVAVIVNANSATSKAIGTYFQSAREIPAVNMIYVSVPEQEVIDDATFCSLQSQIETYLTSHNLTDAINYLVTTKGVPLKINRELDGSDPFSTASASASVESELSLILGSCRNSIGGAGRIISPYYNAGRHFSKAVFGIFLVTRLDGYSVDDVFNLIDRAHPGMSPDKASLFVFDQDPGWNSTVPYLNAYLSDAAAQLSSKGRNVRLNSDSVYVTCSTDVLGYASWGSNDHFAHDFTQHAKPHNNWAPGAIAETYVSTSARSFTNPPVYGQSLIADLVSEGVSGAKGYVYEPFSSAMAISSILFGTYTDGYNLAESYFQSSVYLSWMDVIVGDPKTSIDGSSPVPLPVQLSSLTASLDLLSAKVVIQWTTQSEIQNYGFYVQRRTGADGAFADLGGSFTPGAMNSLAVHTYAYDDHAPAAGVYQYRLKQVDLDGTAHFSDAVEVHVNGTTGISGNAPYAGDFRLEQNYPNPFNPKTGIRFQSSGIRDVRLVVYDALGREIAVLVDGTISPGMHEVQFDGSALPSGTYFSTLTDGASRMTRKMILQK